ncbi:hypothetical protein DPMN_077240 [Dreissena polymorpha]|uniref:Uncharacterized protein n=1 Tax=Dreissena polymorpha TaxID=45954 RepID=A0A9D3YK49_DREPO|nr:hypothetical protein DPMN_077240 [Dreissena polymorpha]
MNVDEQSTTDGYTPKRSSTNGSTSDDSSPDSTIPDNSPQEKSTPSTLTTAHLEVSSAMHITFQTPLPPKPSDINTGIKKINSSQILN